MHGAAKAAQDHLAKVLAGTEAVVPHLIELFESCQPSGRIRAADLAEPGR